MSQSEQKVVQYLDEAHATELALVRVLQEQVAMTPRGSYRTALETHLGETREHAQRVERRLQQLGEGSNPVMAVVGAVQAVVGQALALGKAPFDLLRGSGGEEKVLKNAKDACASESLEIATYTAIERLARSVGDDETAELAVSIRADEEKMLERLLREIPKLTEAVVSADVKGERSYDVTATGAADTVREAGKAAKNAGRKTTAATKRPARQVGVARGRAAGQRFRGGRRRARYRRLRDAHRGGDHRQADRALSERAGQDRRVRAHPPQPHDGPQPHQHAAGRRAVPRRRPGKRKRRRRGA